MDASNEQENQETLPNEEENMQNQETLPNEEENMQNQENQDNQENQSQSVVTKNQFPSVEEITEYYEKQIKDLEQTLSEIYDLMDRVTEMRVQCADMEIEYATMFSPGLLERLQKANDICPDCKGLILFPEFEKKKKSQGASGYSKESSKN